MVISLTGIKASTLPVNIYASTPRQGCKWVKGSGCLEGRSAQFASARKQRRTDRLTKCVCQRNMEEEEGPKKTRSGLLTVPSLEICDHLRANTRKFRGWSWKGIVGQPSCSLPFLEEKGVLSFPFYFRFKPRLSINSIVILFQAFPSKPSNRNVNRNINF